MAHDVFISHASKDREIANAICGKLESARVRCWIAPRDISAGEDWTVAIRSAIGSSRLMVFVFSENANAAPHKIEKSHTLSILGEPSSRSGRPRHRHGANFSFISA